MASSETPVTELTSTKPTRPPVAPPTGVVSPPDNWWLSLVFFRGSVLWMVSFRIAIVMLFCLILNILRYLKYDFPNLSPQAHVLLGVALGLLLVFRTNSAYDRFWEGRKMWGTIVVNSRVFARVVSSLPTVTRTHDDCLRLLPAFALLVKHRLRDNSYEEEETELMSYLQPRTQQMMVGLRNRPLAVLKLLSDHVAWLVESGKVAIQIRPVLENCLNQMGDAQTACERIINTPMPYPYLVQIRQLVFFYVFTLPLVLEYTYPTWVSLAAIFMLSFGFFGIEEAGRAIENPFGTDECDLPLETYCALIEDDCKQVAQLQQDLANFQLDPQDDLVLAEKFKEHQQHQQQHDQQLAQAVATHATVAK